MSHSTVKDSRVLRLEIECDGIACGHCQYCDPGRATCRLFCERLDAGPNGLVRCASCLRSEAPTTMPPVLWKNIDGLDAMPIANACVVVSVDDKHFGIILTAQESDARSAIAALIAERRLAERIVACIRQAVDVCRDREEDWSSEDA